MTLSTYSSGARGVCGAMACLDATSRPGDAWKWFLRGQVVLWLTANEEKDASTEQLIDDDLTFDGNLGFSVFKLQVRRA